MYESPTTKELKKKYSSRLIGEVERGRRGAEDTRLQWWLVDREGQVAAADWTVPHSRAGKLGGTTGE